MCLFSICVTTGICHNKNPFLKTGNASFPLGNSGSGVVFSTRLLVLLWFVLEEGNPQRSCLTCFLGSLRFLWHTCFTGDMGHCYRHLKPAVTLISSRAPGFKSKMIFISDFYTMKMAASLVENVANLSPNCWLIPVFSPQDL